MTLETEGPIRSVAWPNLLAGGGLVRPAAGRLVLTVAGGNALDRPAHETLRLLWRAWQKARFDELLRISGIRGVSTLGYGLSEPPKRRRRIASALGECPAGKWIPVDDFFDHIRAAGHDFWVTRDPSRLFMEDYFKPQPLDLWSGNERWLILQGRYTLCVLFEYASTLGMLDVAYTSPVRARSDAGNLPGGAELISRYDGLRYFRLTALGRYCLGLDDAYRTPLPAANGLFRVAPDLKIAAEPGRLLQADKLVLDAYAAPVSAGAWRLERAKLLEAAEAGHSIARFREFLARKSSVPLPPSVEEFFVDCEDRAAALELGGPAFIVTCRDAALADRIAGDRRLRKLCLRAGERQLVVPSGSEVAFRRALRILGYGLPGRSRSGTDEIG